MQPRFSGFSGSALEFFRELKQHNTREWFQPRKERYEQTVRQQMAELVEALNEEMRGYAGSYICEAKKAIYRIYRDTRFSSDKTPYKTHIAASWPHRGLEKQSSAGYYLCISPEEVAIGGGLYMILPREILAVRTHISETYDRLMPLLREPKLRKLMGELQGESLTRPPKGFPAGDPAIELLKKKQWYFYVTLPAEIATSPALFKVTVARFRAMAPVLDYLNQPLLAMKQQAARAAVML
jgi:uncharacterized protein (TIGR02453 family)